MMGWEFANDKRSVSEIYGTVLIISLVLLTALLLVGAGSVIVSELTSDSEKDVGRQNVIEMDDRLSQLAKSDTDDTTTIEFGDDADVSAEPDQGEVEISVKTNDTYWNEGDKPGSFVGLGKNNQSASHNITLGTILHNGDESETAFQGGGVWEKQGDSVEIVSAPDVDRTGDSLQLSFIDISDVDFVAGGSTLTVSENATSSSNRSQQIMQSVTERISRNGTVLAEAEVNATITSRYAAGWANYAEQGMTDSENITVYRPGDLGGKLDSDQVKISFGSFGDPASNVPDPKYKTLDHMIYTGLSRDAAVMENTDISDVEGVSPEGFEITNPGASDYQVGIYSQNESAPDRAGWWIWNNSQWENIEDPTVDPVSQADADDLAGVYSPSPSSGEFYINDTTWTCAIDTTNTTEDFSEYVTDPADGGNASNGCMADPVDVDNPENGHAEFYPQVNVSNLDVTVYENGASQGQNGKEIYYPDQVAKAEVTLKNVGTGNATDAVLGLALNQTDDGDDPELVNGSTNIPTILKNGGTHTETFVLNSTTDFDQFAKYNISAGTQYDSNASRLWEVKPDPGQNIDFRVRNPSVRYLGNTPPVQGGDEVAVDFEVKNLGSDGGTKELQLYSDSGTWLNSTQINLPAGPIPYQTETIRWTIPPNPTGDVDVKVRVRNPDDVTSTDTVELVSNPAVPEFDVSIDSYDNSVTVGDTMTVDATVENVGGQQGTQTVRLKTIDTSSGDESTVTGKTRTLDTGNDDSVSLTWTPGAGDTNVDEIAVATNDNSESRTVNVNPPVTNPEDFEVQNIAFSPGSTVTEGDTMTIDADIENVGSASGTQSVKIRTINSSGDDTLVYAEDLTLSDGGSDTVTYNWGTSGETDIEEIKVETEDGSEQTESVDISSNTVNPNYNVQVDSVTSPVAAGDDIDVDVNVKNTGDSKEETLILRDLDGNPVDSIDVDPGSSWETKTLTWTTDATDAGENGNVEAVVAGESATESVQIQDSTATFTITNVDAPGSITEGDELSVDVTVENTGSGAGTKETWLSVDSNPKEFKPISGLSQGSTETKTLTWQTTSGDAEQDKTITLATPDDSTTETVDIQAATSGSANFEVDITDTNAPPSSPILEGVDELTVDVEVTNTGSSSGTQTVILENYNGNDVVLQEVSLGPSGDSQTITLNWQTAIGDGTGSPETIEVRSEDDTDTETVQVDQQTAETRDPVDVSIVIDETGSMGTEDPDQDRNDATRTALDALDGSLGDRAGLITYTAALPGNTRTEQALTNDLEDVNDSITNYVTGGTDIVSAIEAGRTMLDNPSDNEKYMLLLTDGKHNEGCGGWFGPDCTEQVKDAADQIEGDITVYSIAFGSYDEEAMRYAAEDGGTEDGEFLEADDSDELEDIFEGVIDEVTEAERPAYQVDITDTNAPVEQGESLEVDVEVENTGNATRQRPVTLSLDGSDAALDGQMVNVSVGATETKTLEWDTTGVAPGSKTLNVSSPSNSDTESAEVLSKQVPEFEVSIATGPSDVDAGNSATYSVLVENTGGAAGTQDIVLQNFAGAPEDTRSITLSAGGSQSINDMQWDTDPSDAGKSGQVTVSSEDDTATQSLDILGSSDNSNFLVTIDDTNADPGSSSVVAGDDLEVDVTVENTGSESGTQYLRLYDGDGDLRDSIEVPNLGDGSSVTETLGWTTAEDGTQPISVESDDTTASTPVKIKDPDASEFKVVSLTSTDDPIEEGQSMDMEVEIKNVGSTSGNATLKWDVATGSGSSTPDILVDEPPEIAPGATETFTVPWDTEDGDSDIDEIKGYADQSGKIYDVEIQDSSSPEADFDIVSIDTNADEAEGESIEAGDSLDFNVTVNNTGGKAAAPWIDVGSFGSYEISPPVAPGDGKVNVKFTRSTASDDYTVDTVDISVLDADVPNYDINITQGVSSDTDFQVTGMTVTKGDVPTNPVLAGSNDPVEVEVTVDNQGGTGTEYVELRSDPSGANNFATGKTVSLGSGNQATVTLTWTSHSSADGSQGTPPAVDVKAQTDSDNTGQTGTVYLEQPTPSSKNWDVSILDTNADPSEGESITAGDDLVVDIRLELNKSIPTATDQTVELDGNQLGLNFTTGVTPDTDQNRPGFDTGGESAEVTLRLPTRVGAGADSPQTILAKAAGESAGRSVDVRKAAKPAPEGPEFGDDEPGVDIDIGDIEVSG